MPSFGYPLRNRSRLWFSGKSVQHVSNVDETLGSVSIQHWGLGGIWLSLFVGNRKKLHKVSKTVLFSIEMVGWLFCLSKATKKKSIKYCRVWAEIKSRVYLRNKNRSNIFHLSLVSSFLLFGGKSCFHRVFPLIKMILLFNLVNINDFTLNLLTVYTLGLQFG